MLTVGFMMLSLRTFSNAKLSFTVCQEVVELLQHFLSALLRKVLKVARRGLYSTAALYIADCALAPYDVVPFFISRGATTPRGEEALY
jgi:hypothetical protein